MILNLYSLIKPDKYIEHPIFGGVSCSGFHNAFKKCNELMTSNQSLSIQCKSLFDITMSCYRSGNEQEFNHWIDEQINERRSLQKFLSENESVLPRLQKKRMAHDLFVALDEENEINKSKGEKFNLLYEEEAEKNKKFL